MFHYAFNCCTLSLSGVFSEAFARVNLEGVQNVPDVLVVASGPQREELKLRNGVLDLLHDQLTLNTDDFNNIINFICTA